MKTGPWSDAEKDYIAKTYATHTAQQQADALGRSVFATNHQRSYLLKAGKIKMHQRTYNAPWSQDEQDSVKEYLKEGWSARRIAKKLGRSPAAVVCWLNSRGLTVREERQRRTVQQVAALFGVCDETVFNVWIPRGWLKVHRDIVPHKERRGRRKPRPQHYVTDEQLAEFVADRRGWPFWDPRWMTDPDWRETAQELRDAAGGHWLSVVEVARRYAYSESIVRGWIRARLLKAERLTNAFYIWSTDLEGFTPPPQGSGIWADNGAARRPWPQAGGV